MASTAVYWHYNSTDTGLVLKVYDETAGTLVNGAGGDALTHDANGRYTATIAETLSGRYRVVVENGSGIMLSEGFSNIVDGGTNVMGLWEASATQATTIISDIATVDAVVDGTAATVSANLDATVSSRLATAGYTAPDNASITAILEDTGTTLPAAIAALPGSVATQQLTESYADNGDAPTLEQALMAIHQMLMSFGVSGTTWTVKRLDNATTAFIATLDDATNPTGISREVTP